MSQEHPSTSRGEDGMREVGGVVPLAQLLSPVTLMANMRANWTLVVQFSKRELMSKNKGSSLGIVWTIVHPLLMLAVYTFVFAVVWQAKWGMGGGTGEESKAQFAISVFCGLIVFDIFASCVGPSTGLIVNNSNFVKKVIFPLEVLPVSLLGAGLCIGGISTSILLIANGVLNSKVSETLYMFPLVLVPLMAWTMGLSWLVASLGVYLRDLRQVVAGVLLPVFFFATPIFYPPERVPAGFEWVVTWNPMAPVIDASRRTLLYGQVPDWMPLGVVTLVGFIVLQLGFAFFMKSKRSFADVL
jgi:lipopolysaccharide transport system permease protein